MKLLPIDAGWVRRMAVLADGPWTREVVESALRAHGWAGPDPVVWDPGEPHHLPGEAGEAGDEEEGPTGWKLELGEPPPADPGEAPEPHSFVALPFALLWPPPGLLDDDWDDEEEEDDLDEDYSAAWARRPEAGPEEFHAEFDRVGTLVRELLGPPTRTFGVPGDEVRREIWDRGPMALVLAMDDDVPTYSHYDRIALTVRPSSSAGWTEEG
ncbi:hypothetical protein DPM19_06445 [Actinomadura craniellae]|uniref:Uncharacterized protein n=1 Tax=Actinomadura craniellae TaxID=2231787 RepID=A0A365HBT4_9ACTN|nr:hypothetical protein DPM19_06445 [Actinomadura craniellae]